MREDQKRKVKGVLAPVVTPFAANLEPDIERWLTHCRWLVAQGIGLAVFGTTSEANSLSLDQRLAMLEALSGSEISTCHVMPGTGACNMEETIKLTKAACALDCVGVLMLPPFYYKDVPMEGLFRYFAEVIERVGDNRLKIYLYHIPQVAQVSISFDLIARLRAAFPGIIAGIKDSSGDWENMRTLIERFDDFAVFSGSEALLLNTMRAGGAGCISATANISPTAIHALWKTWKDGDSDKKQADLTAFRQGLARFSMIPALKATIAETLGDEDWARVRPPLIGLDVDERRQLASYLSDQMPKHHELGVS